MERIHLGCIRYVPPRCLADLVQEAFTFKDILAQAGPVHPTNSFTDIPDYLQKYPQRFPYLLTEGCRRPNHAGQ